jgi:hypothetical protein
LWLPRFKRDHGKTLHGWRRIDFFGSAIESVFISPRVWAPRRERTSDLWLAGTDNRSDLAESHRSSAIFKRAREGRS